MRQPIPEINMREVFVRGESFYREQSRRIHSFVPPDITWIKLDQLYETLAHGEPGWYVIEGI